MNKRTLIGKEIVNLKQSRFYRDTGEFLSYCIDEIILSNGTRLYPIVYEGDGEYGVSFITVKDQHDA